MGEGFSRGLSAAVVACWIAGCAQVGPDFEAPAPPVNQSWETPPEAGLAPTPFELVEWWHVFDDPTLDSLVESAYRQNYGLEIAGFHIFLQITKKCTDSDQGCF